MASSELVPFFTHKDLYLRPIHKVRIEVTLPKLRQMGQSVSNWEIRERLKKMLQPIEVGKEGKIVGKKLNPDRIHNLVLK